MREGLGRDGYTLRRMPVLSKNRDVADRSEWRAFSGL